MNQLGVLLPGGGVVPGVQQMDMFNPREIQEMMDQVQGSLEFSTLVDPPTRTIVYKANGRWSVTNMGGNIIDVSYEFWTPRKDIGDFSGGTSTLNDYYDYCWVNSFESGSTPPYPLQGPNQPHVSPFECPRWCEQMRATTRTKTFKLRPGESKTVYFKFPGKRMLDYNKWQTPTAGGSFITNLIGLKGYTVFPMFRWHGEMGFGIDDDGVISQENCYTPTILVVDWTHKYRHKNIPFNDKPQIYYSSGEKRPSTGLNLGYAWQPQPGSTSIPV